MSDDTCYNLQRRPVTIEYGTRFRDHGYKLHWEIWCGVGDLDYVPDMHQAQCEYVVIH